MKQPNEILENNFNDDWEYMMNCHQYSNYYLERELSLQLQFQIADDINDMIRSYLISNKEIIKQDYLRNKARRYNEAV